MNIVVLDGYTLNPGDLSWQGLEALGECAIYDRTPADQTVERAGNAEIVITNKTELHRGVLEQLPRLRYIGVLATGFNVVDIDAAREQGVPVTNVPAYGTESVAQMTFAHLLNLTQRVGNHAQTVRDGAWSQCEDFCYWRTPLVELQGCTLGIVGFGRIGHAVCRIARAFGMHGLVYDVAPPTAGLPEGVQFVAEIDELLPEVDVLSLHCPLTASNRHLINAERLGRMKSTALLVNTSRGALVDEKALAAALNEGQLAGAGLDVLDQEPPDPANPLLSARNCFVTPHISWATKAARARLMEVAVDNVRAFLDGRIENQVNP